MRTGIKGIKVEILKILQELDAPAGAARLAAQLQRQGIHLQPRTVRMYLAQLDHEKLTRFISRRRGRELTALGREELVRSNVIEKVGFIAARIDELVYRMTFSLKNALGSLVTNVSFLHRARLARALEDMKPVFAAQLGMGNRMALIREGQRGCGRSVPDDQVAIATICSVTVNGILLKAGIPVTSRFGGLLEMREGQAVRFVELMEYRGVTLDPLEFFIRAGMTRVRECARTGSGLIGASFREFPSVALPDVARLIREMQRLGLSGVLAVGQPNQPLFDIPVAEGRTGMVVAGGLNPIAAMAESGAEVVIQPLAGLMDYHAFAAFEDLRLRFAG